eukprot:s1130_g16.t1
MKPRSLKIRQADVRAVPDPARQQPDERRGAKRPEPEKGKGKGKGPSRPQSKAKATPKAAAQPATEIITSPSSTVLPTTSDSTSKPSDPPIYTKPSSSIASPEGQSRMIPGTPTPGTPRPEAAVSTAALPVATGNLCSVPDCVLPGGHSGPHKEDGLKTFSWTSQGGRVDLEGDDEMDSPTDLFSDSSPTSSEELQPEEDVQNERHRSKRKHGEGEEMMFYALEIDVDGESTQYLWNHPRKMAIRLSKKMMMKPKEHRWQELPLERKVDFDLAQAKELTNVLQSKALRALAAEEKVDHKRCIQMRWVLTTKSDGTAKARLVILGFQQPNLTEVQSSAPTLARISRNMLLATCINLGLRLRAGDVTSAFLQTSASIEDQDLTVWSTPELAVLFGAPPENLFLPLRVVKPFYGLVHSSREWYNGVSKTLVKTSWKKLVSDGCFFILVDPADNSIVGLAGIHVDDFLIGGLDGNPVFDEAFKALEGAYKPKTVHSDYTEKWTEEIEITKERASSPKAPATPAEVSQLQGLIGTLAWRSSQTSAHFQADVGLLLSEVPYATVDALQQANKLVREIKRTKQSLLFPSWRLPWQQLAVVVWADASNSNRPDKSSTIGILAGLAPSTILSGSKEQIALIQWRSSKTPRQVLGSNGAEVQSITEGEDLCFRLRALLAEINGQTVTRQNLISLCP